MKTILMMFVCVLCHNYAQAQVKIGVGAGAPHSSAILEIESTSKGLLLPRMTSTERSSISSPATGLVIYNTTLACVEMYNGSAWGSLGFISSPNTATLGSTYTSPHGSATTAFSTNSNCSSSLVSAGYNSSNCNGTVSVGSNNYVMAYINGQCWMKTNLNGEPSNYSYNNTWLNNTSYSTDSARYGYYHINTTNGSAGFQATEPAAGEGYLYQWNAAMNGSLAERAQGACPSGWHIPSDCEVMYLEHGLGMSVADQTTGGAWRSSNNVGSKLSALSSGGTNSSGFTGLMAGFRNYTNGAFSNRGTRGYIWTSSVSGTTEAFNRGIDVSQVGVSRDPISRAYAISVRCLRD